MTPTELILNERAGQQGWTPATKLDLALIYIETQADLGTWRDFLSDVAAAENAYDDRVGDKGHV